MIIANEIVSDFKLNGTSIQNLTFESSIVTLGADAVFSINLDISATPPQTDTELKARFSRLLLTVSGNATSPVIQDAKTDFHLVLEGEFTSSLEMPAEQFENLLWHNGTATLYSIARSKLEAISALAYHSGKITLPMINIVEFLKAKNEQASSSSSGEE